MFIRNVAILVAASFSITKSPALIHVSAARRTSVAVTVQMPARGRGGQISDMFSTLLSAVVWHCQRALGEEHGNAPRHAAPSRCAQTTTKWRRAWRRHASRRHPRTNKPQCASPQHGEFSAWGRDPPSFAGSREDRQSGSRTLDPWCTGKMKTSNGGCLAGGRCGCALFFSSNATLTDCSVGSATGSRTPRIHAVSHQAMTSQRTCVVLKVNDAAVLRTWRNRGVTLHRRVAGGRDA